MNDMTYLSWENLSWFLVAISLIGNVFVIQKKVAGQVLWAIANLGWISYNLYLGAIAQAFLFSVYTLLCFWGIWLWTRADKEAKTATAL